jgi:hypothetical protein
MGGQRHAPAALPRERDPVLLEASWALVPVWTAAEDLAPNGIRSPDRQPVASGRET